MGNKQLTSEADRATLRDYLVRRLQTLRSQGKKAEEKEEQAYVEGGEMEIIFIFDELLGEQTPELPKRRKAL